MSLLRTVDIDKNLFFWEMQLSILVNQKVSIGVEPGTIDDIEYAEPETQSGHINRARQSMHIARLTGGVISGNDTQRFGVAVIDQLKTTGAVGYNQQVIQRVNSVSFTGRIHRSGNTRSGR